MIKNALGNYARKRNTMYVTVIHSKMEVAKNAISRFLPQITEAIQMFIDFRLNVATTHDNDQRYEKVVYFAIKTF